MAARAAMTWVKTDDAFWRSQRTLDLLDLGPVGVAAIALDRLVEAWVGEALTDGCVPSGQPARVFAPNDPVRAIAALVKAGLWEERPDGWYLTTWFEPYGIKRKPRNPTRADVLLERQRRHELGVLGGQANAQSVDDEGRRDAEGKFDTNRTVGRPDGPTVGGTVGTAAGATDGQPTARLDSPPTAEPTMEPSPYPVPRSPVSRKGERGRKSLDGARVNGPVHPSGKTT